MKDPKTNIILYLNQSMNWVTAKDISENAKLSARSVKYHISLINKTLSNTILSSNRGYKLNRINISEIMQKFFIQDKPITYLDRKKYILRELLVNKKKFEISELADSLFISESTLLNELSKIRVELIPHRIKLHIKKDIISISGDKNDMQTYYMALVKNEMNDTVFDIDSVQNMFSKVSLKKIEGVVKKELENTQYFLDNYSMLSVIFHLGLIIEFNNYNSVNRKYSSKIKLKEHVANCAIRILDCMKKEYGYQYTFNDVFETSILLMNKVFYSIDEEMDNDTLTSVVGKDIIELMEFIIEKVESNYAIKLKNKNFEVRFAFHLQKLLLRAKNDNPVSFTNNYIKNQYPMMYSIATFVAYLIEQKKNISVSEEEISYIALHIGVLIEAQNTTKNKISCVIFSPDYYLLGQTIYDKLQSNFSELIEIRRFITTYIGLDTISNDVDLIISTVKIKTPEKCKLAVISTQVNFNDIQNIYNVLNSINMTNQKYETKVLLSTLLREDLFFADVEFNSDKEAIEFLAKKLYDNKIVNKNYLENILKRETLAPSSYGRIAIPHPLENNAKKSALAIAVCKKPIKWGFNEVNIIIMLAIKPESNTLFVNVFNYLADPISDNDSFEKILNVKTYSEFVDLLLNN